MRSSTWARSPRRRSVAPKSRPARPSQAASSSPSSRSQDQQRAFQSTTTVRPDGRNEKREQDRHSKHARTHRGPVHTPRSLLTPAQSRQSAAASTRPAAPTPAGVEVERAASGPVRDRASEKKERKDGTHMVQLLQLVEQHALVLAHLLERTVCSARPNLDCEVAAVRDDPALGDEDRGERTHELVAPGRARPWRRPARRPARPKPRWRRRGPAPAARGPSWPTRSRLSSAP